MWMKWWVALLEWFKRPRTKNRYEYVTDENGNETVKDNTDETVL
jgi:hypothetical protein